MAFASLVWKCLEFGGARLASAGPDQIRLAMTIRLPFRLAFAALARLKATQVDDDEMCFQNELMVPENIEDRQLRNVYRANPRLWWTDCAIVMRPRSLLNEVMIQYLRERKDTYPEIDSDLFKCYCACSEAAGSMLNSCVIAYHEATSVIVGGEPLRMVDAHYFIMNRRANLWVVCPNDYVLSDSNVRAIIEVDID